jgi:hypothetical protein
MTEAGAPGSPCGPAGPAGPAGPCGPAAPGVPQAERTTAATINVPSKTSIFFVDIFAYLLLMFFELKLSVKYLSDFTSSHY